MHLLLICCHVDSNIKSRGGLRSTFWCNTLLYFHEQLGRGKQKMVIELLAWFIRSEFRNTMAKEEKIFSKYNAYKRSILHTRFYVVFDYCIICFTSKADTYFFLKFKIELASVNVWVIIISPVNSLIFFYHKQMSLHAIEWHQMQNRTTYLTWQNYLQSANHNQSQYCTSSIMTNTTFCYVSLFLNSRIIQERIIKVWQLFVFV